MGNGPVAAFVFRERGIHLEFQSTDCDRDCDRRTILILLHTHAITCIPFDRTRKVIA